MVGWSDEVEARWRRLTEDVLVGMKEWRQAHPLATLREIETTLDEKLAKVRARMLEDVALASKATDLVGGGERAVCPRCGQELEAHGRQERTLTTTGNQEVHLRRSYAACPACDAGLFPLDEELELLPGPFTPRLIEDLVHLGTWMPFPVAARNLGRFHGVTVSEPTARRWTEKAGAALVTHETAEGERLGRAEAPAPQVRRCSK